jgi:hypothetical protein
MSWLHEAAYFFGGAFFANAVPHTVAGLMGRPFQSPFAKPPGQGLSSSTTNVLWGFANLALAYGLLVRVGTFDGRSLADVGAAGAGALAISLFSAAHFGRFNGGHAPSGKS